MLPLRPPIAPMLARLTRELPDAGYAYEPKWDGFRCLAFRAAGEPVELRSRHDRPLARYFPEVVAALDAVPGSFVIDGELVVHRDAAADFPALLSRLHPAASRVGRLAAELPARYVAFDVLAIGDEVLCDRPFIERRVRLETLLATSPVAPAPLTLDRAVAAGWLERGLPAGADGVVAKALDLRYQPGRRAMVKVKPERTADCVVAGLRVFVDRPAVSSLLLGAYDGPQLRHLGVVQAFPEPVRRALLAELRPLATPLTGHPWRPGFGLEGGPTGRLKGAGSRWTPALSLDWLPLRPERVVEVRYDALDGLRFRHPARFLRWRPDREPASCRVDQFEVS